MNFCTIKKLALVTGIIELMVGVSFADNTIKNVPGMQNKQEQTALSRYQMYFSPIARRDTFLLDTTTGRVWIAVGDGNSVNYFQELPVQKDDNIAWQSKLYSDILTEKRTALNGTKWKQKVDAEIYKYYEWKMNLLCKNIDITTVANGHIVRCNQADPANEDLLPLSNIVKATIEAFPELYAEYTQIENKYNAWLESHKEQQK